MARNRRWSRDFAAVLPGCQPDAPRLVSALLVDAAGARGGGAAGRTRNPAAELGVADLATRATSGAIWTYASYTTGRALVFVGMAAVTRLLRPDDFGLFNMAAVAINLL